MELLVCVINKPELLDDVLAGFIEVGVSGCTVIDSKGMGTIIANEVPIFSGFKNLFSGVRESSYTVFAVIQDNHTLENAIKVVKEIYDSAEDADAGILFTLPVTNASGIKPQ